VAMGCWDAGEHNTEPRGGARLVEESRFSFEKSRSTNSGISRNATHSDRQRRAGEDGTVEAKRWERGRPELLVWLKTTKNKTKNTKSGSENRKEKGEEEERNKVYSSSPKKPYTKRWKPHKIVNIS
jgi:hypothetical protein